MGRSSILHIIHCFISPKALQRPLIGSAYQFPLAVTAAKDIKDYGGHRKYLNPKGLNLTDFWEDTSPARHKKYKSRWHINELKPVIPERCILISTNSGEIILDPFGGGGSTYVVAERLKRFWIGSEIGACDPVIKRFQAEFHDLTRTTEIPNPLRLFFEQSREDRLAANA